MPLRRRPPEPSPRVRALLERARVGAVAEVEPADSPWQPDRAWLASSAHQGVAGGVRGVGAGGASAGAPGDVVGDVRGGVATRPAGRHRRPMPHRPRLLTLPTPLQGARLTGPRAAVVGLLIVVLVAAIGFGARVALARASAEPQPLRTSSGSALAPRQGAGAFASSTTASGGGGPPRESGGRSVTVHVVGQVARPGVVQLSAGARVSDALAKAGGAVRGADLAAVNLARLLVDGEQIRVPKPGEVVQGAAGALSGPGAGSATGGTVASGGMGASPGALVDLNNATAAQLEALPGVGPVLAQRIVDWRTEHGRFTSVDELGEVSGIGEKIFAQLQPKVTV